MAHRSARAAPPDSPSDKAERRGGAEREVSVGRTRWLRPPGKGSVLAGVMCIFKQKQQIS
eukprot:scaffold232316_cov39-Tisochrysis_lutea.AAC.1